MTTAQNLKPIPKKSGKKISDPISDFSTLREFLNKEFARKQEVKRHLEYELSLIDQEFEELKELYQQVKTS